MSKKILEFCLSPDLGGLELMVAESFYDFSLKTETFIVVAPNTKLDNYIDSSKKHTIKRNKLLAIIPALQVAKLIDKYKIDVIHFHWTKDIATVVLAKKLSSRKPKIVQSRHMSMTRFKDDFYHNWLYSSIDLIHAVTEQVKEQLVKYIPQGVRPKLKMVYLGVEKPSVESRRVDELKVSYQLQESFVVGMIGRIEEGKGQYILLEALAKLKHLPVKVLIVGSFMSESYQKELEKMVSDLGIEKQVIFSGFTKEVNEHIRLCDVTVLATPKETFGLVVIESMVNGVPVIATANGGPLEIIKDGVDGLLFDRTPSDLSVKIELVYQDRAFKEKIAQAARKKVKERFDKTIQMAKLYEVINES